MSLPTLPPETVQFVLGLISKSKVLDGKGSSAFQSLAAGLADRMGERDRAKVKADLAGMRAEVQEAHDDFRAAARGRPPR